MSQNVIGTDQFHDQFQTEEDCAGFLFHMKWPNGFSCPHCGHRHAYKTSTRRLPLYECAHCRHQTSLTAGTVMQGSRTDLRKWFLAMFLAADPTKGINAVELSRQIHVTYKTAWLMLHKIHHAMGVIDVSILLSRIVQVNSADYGRPCNSTISRHAKQYPILIGATMSKQNEPAYVKMKLVPDEHMNDDKMILRTGTEAFAKQHAERGAYIMFTTKRYIPKRLKPLLPLFSGTTKWINETFYGLGPRYLQAYLNEYCFRLNLKLKNAEIFEKLVHTCAVNKAVTYKVLKRWQNRPEKGERSPDFSMFSKTNFLDNLVGLA